MIILEVTRRDLNQKNRDQTRERYNKRLDYRPTKFDGINIKKLFEEDILVFTTDLGGHEAIISFEGLLEVLKEQLKKTQRICTYRDTVQSLSYVVDNNDVYLRCSCGDWKYRYAYMATIGGYIYGPPEMRPNNFDRTNKALIGGTCKHLGALLSNKGWVRRVAQALNNYIRLNKESTYDYLYETQPIDDDYISDDQISMYDDEDFVADNTEEEKETEQEDETEKEEDNYSRTRDYDTDKDEETEKDSFDAHSRYSKWNKDRNRR